MVAPASVAIALPMRVSGMKAAFEAAGVTVIHSVDFGMQAQRIGLPAPAMRTGALRAAPSRNW